MIQRKGLSKDYLWVLAAIVNTKFSKELLYCSLLAQAFENVVSLETYFASLENESGIMNGSDSRKYLNIFVKCISFVTSLKTD